MTLALAILAIFAVMAALMYTARLPALVALPLIFQNFWDARKAPSAAVTDELMETVKIYNQVEAGDEAAVRQAVEREYRFYWRSQGAKA